MQTNRPSIRAGLNRAGLRTQGGVVGGATPADRAREPTAAPEASSFAPKNVQAQAVQNRAKADERDAGEMATAAAARPAAPRPSASDAAAKMRDQDDAEERSARSSLPANPPSPPPRPSAAPAAARPAAPRPAARAAATPRPAAPAAAPEPKSKQMFQAAQDRGDDATAADFFAADRQMQKERGLNESLESTIRKMTKQ